MFKNAIIGFLLLLSLALLILNFSNSTINANNLNNESPPMPINSGAVTSSLTKGYEKLDRSSVIKQATIEGIGLSTNPKDIQTLAGKANFKCLNNDPSAEQSEWSCTHNKLDATTLKISAHNGKITQIMRHGGITPDDLSPTMNQIEDLKFLLNTRENVSFTQSEDNFTLTIRNQTKDQEENLDYSIMNQRIRDIKNPEKTSVTRVYSAVLSTRAR